MYRRLFLLAVYSGIRAAYNRVVCWFLASPKTAKIDRMAFFLRDIEPCRIRVHARKKPPVVAIQSSGMVSVYLTKPGISKLFYGIFLATSHFGFGHIEIAFFERDGSTVLYAVRNIVRSNVERTRWGPPAGLKMLNERDEVAAVRAVINELQGQGIEVSFAEPETCVAMAVSPSLISPHNQRAAIKALTKKYRRITKSLANV